MNVARPTVLVVSPGVEGGLGSSISRGFEHLGWVVRSLSWPPNTLLARTAYRSHITFALLQAQFPFSSLQPSDLVIVVKGPGLSRRTIARLRAQTGASVVCWNPDSPFDPALSNHGAGVAEAIADYDAYITWTPLLVPELLRAGAQNVVVVPFGWDPAIHRPGPRDENTSGRVVFVGSGSPERVDWILHLRMFRPIVFGNHWPAMAGIEQRPAVTGQRFCSVLGSAAAALNFLRPQNQGSHNMRTFEIPACGGLQIAQWSQEHETFLGEPDNHLFGDPDDLCRTVENALKLNRSWPPETPEWLTSHTYRDRCESLATQLQALGILPHSLSP